MKIQTTSVEQTANELLGTKAKKLYYLLIENSLGKKITINVGEKTHDQVKKLNEEEIKNTEELKLKEKQPELNLKGK